MPELRKDPIVDRWVIVAQNRALRPHDIVEHQVARTASDDCPFCEGHEHHTPGEIRAARSPGTSPDGPGWRVRVVPNKYPALEIEGGLDRHVDGMFDRMQGVGAHEVIIESPRHLLSTTQLSDDEMREVLLIYRERLVDLARDPRFRYGMLFKNVGAAAGASLEHTHSQLIVTPIVPINVVEELRGARDYFDRNRRCVYCDMIEQERVFEQRVVHDSGGFVAFCPFAARFPFETWIVPREHASGYESLTESGARELARVLRVVLAKIESALDRPAYNYIIHTAPFDTTALDHYHWHIEIIPRVTKTAGFEWGTGFHINPMSPEEAAALMRALTAVS